MTGIKFSSPKGNTVRVALPEEDVQRLEAGYSLTRLQFDHLLFDRCQNLVRENGGKVIQGGKVTNVLSDDGEAVMTPEWEVETRDMPKVFNSQLVAGKGEEFTYYSTEVIGAGGYQCPVAKAVVKDSYGEEMVDQKHYCGGYREYWKNVKRLRRNCWRY